jgi:hypothetical protein
LHSRNKTVKNKIKIIRSEVLLPIVNRRDQCGERNERVLKWKLRKTGFESKEGGEIEIKPLEMFR